MILVQKIIVQINIIILNMKRLKNRFISLTTKQRGENNLAVKRNAISPQENICAIYARFSSGNQREESIDAQVRACAKYAEDNGFVVGKIYADHAKSATTDDREQFQEMMADSAKAKFRHIIIHKLDRFSRDRYDSVIYKRKLKINGIKLHSVLERIDDSPESIFLESLLEGNAEYYSRNLAREVMKGLKENAYQCKHTGGFAPLGYNVDKETKKYLINEEETKIVKSIFEMYTTGHGYKQIMCYLNSLGYKTKAGKAFGSSSVHTILKNEKYTGTYIYNRKKEKGLDGKRRPMLKAEDEIIRIEGGMPQIIDKETFDKAQAILAKNLQNGGKFKAKETYLLSGLAFCGECGSALYGNTRFCGRGKTKYVTYRCSNRAQHKGCKNKEVNKEYLDNFVLDELYSSLFNEESIKKLAKMLTEYNNERNSFNAEELAEVKAQLDSAMKEINNIVELIAQTGIGFDTVKEKIRDLEERKQYLENRIQELTIDKSLQISEETVTELVGKSKNFVKTKNIAECRYFIDSYIEKVLVFNNHVEVYYKIKVPNKDNDSLEVLTTRIDLESLIKDYRIHV